MNYKIDLIKSLKIFKTWTNDMTKIEFKGKVYLIATG